MRDRVKIRWKPHGRGGLDPYHGSAEGAVVEFDFLMECIAMFKTILVPAGGAETDTPVFETALAVARLSAAHLVFLHIRVDVRDVIASMAAGDLGASGKIGCRGILRP